MNGSGIWTISQVSSGVASVTVLTAPNDSLYLPASSVTGEAVGTANGDTTRFTLTTSHKIYDKTSNPKIKKLAKEIIDTQEKEILLMKSML